MKVPQTVVTPSSGGRVVAAAAITRTALAAPAEVITLVRSSNIVVPAPVRHAPAADSVPPPLLFDEASGALLPGADVLTGGPASLVVDELGEEWTLLPGTAPFDRPVVV